MPVLSVSLGKNNKQTNPAGDLLKVDVTVFKDGHHGDTARSLVIGAAADDALCDAPTRRLLLAAREALAAGVEAAQPGQSWLAIARAIDAVALRHGVGVVPSYLGHGVGRQFHQLPAVPMTARDFDVRLLARNTPLVVAGDVFTIEPLVTLGTPRLRRHNSDESWSMRTVDAQFAAVFEHTIEVTATGSEILTQ